LNACSDPTARERALHQRHRGVAILHAVDLERTDHVD
jgi:hypothetical protein